MNNNTIICNGSFYFNNNVVQSCHPPPLTTKSDTNTITLTDFKSLICKRIVGENGERVELTELIKLMTDAYNESSTIKETTATDLLPEEPTDKPNRPLSLPSKIATLIHPQNPDEKTINTATPCYPQQKSHQPWEPCDEYGRVFGKEKISLRCSNNRCAGRIQVAGNVMEEGRAVGIIGIKQHDITNCQRKENLY